MAVSNLVFVGCKLPSGLLIELGEQVGENQAGDKRDAALPILEPGTTTRLFGSAHPGAIEGFGITPLDNANGVVDAWFESHKQFPPVARGYLWYEATADKARDRAYATAGMKNGLEQLDYDNPEGDGSIKPDEKAVKPAR